VGDPAAIGAAADIARANSSFPPTSPDLFNGTAGRARFLLEMWHATRADEFLRDALSLGKQLMIAADHRGEEPAGPLQTDTAASADRQ
jgi:lantibiotic modifying enzyme